MNINLNLQNILSSIISWLGQVVDFMDDFILFGSFSLLDFIIIIAIGNILISAFVVTFRYRGHEKNSSSSRRSSDD